MAKWYIIDESRKIEGAVQGYKTKKRAEQVMKNILIERKKRGQKLFSREFGRSLNLKIEKGT